MDQHHNATGRDTYWDVVKAMLILLVILGHVIQYFQYHEADAATLWGDWLFHGIYIFHMPLFMLVSGYFAAGSVARRSWQAFPRYLKRLALPAVGTGLVSLLLIVVLQGGDHWKSNPGGYPLWFLIAVLECVTCYLVAEWQRSWWYRVVTYILPIPAAMWLNGVHEALWPYSTFFTFLWPFFLLGACMRKMGFSASSIDWKWSTWGVLFVAAFLLFKPEWSFYQRQLAFTWADIQIAAYRTAAATAGCMAFLGFARLVRFLGNYSIVRRAGQATLAIYALQHLVFNTLIRADAIIPLQGGHLASAGVAVILLASAYGVYAVTRHVKICAVFLYGEE